MGKEIMVYFNSGNRAKFDLDSVWFLSEGEIAGTELVKRAINCGKTIIGADSVCFIREYIQPKEDVLNDAE